LTCQRYHGDLRRALLNEALRTIQAEGVEHLTLRTAGERLGVSRTALYRHFTGKQALLAAVGSEGFRMLRQALASAWESNGRGRPGFEAIADAYVGFAIENSSHYRVNVRPIPRIRSEGRRFQSEAKAVFQVRVDALVDQQKASLIRLDDPLLMARFVWAVVHGVVMLAIDGQLQPEDGKAEALNRYGIERLRTAIAAPGA
jgi:AcrR family transcriptional regulator